MMTSMNNKVQLIGHLGKDPELRETTNGKRVLRLSLATNDFYKAADGERKENTEWHTVVAWGNTAEKLASAVRKGSGLIVEGRLTHKTYETKEGEKRHQTEVVLGSYRLLGTRGAAEE